MLRKQVIKGRDIAKLLANKYSEKLATVNSQHAEEMAALRAERAAGLQAVMDKVEALEGAVPMYVGLASARERELNEQLTSLARLNRRQARYIQQLEMQEEELDARVAVVEGKVRGVVREAAQWNARERELAEKLKDESLLIVHLAQREQQMLNEQREMAARVERAEKKAKELEEELTQLQSYYAAREKSNEKSNTESETTPRKADDQSRRSVAAPLVASTTPPSLVLSPSLPHHTAEKPPVIPPRSSSRRSHQRSESLGVLMLQQMRDTEASASFPTALSSQASQPTITVNNNATPVLERASPRGETGLSASLSAVAQQSPPPLLCFPPEDPHVKSLRKGGGSKLRVTAPSVGASIANGDGGGNGSKLRGSRHRSASKSEMEGAALNVAGELADGAGKEHRKSRRGTRKMDRPSGREPMDDVSAEVLASVEAEIALLLKK